MIVFRPSPRFAFSHPAHFIAFGFGAGLSPFAPGTVGTLVALPIWWAIGPAYSVPALFAILAFLFLAGVWACELTGRHLGIADHGAMCWDEVVAFLLVLAIAPQDWRWQTAAFFLFPISFAYAIVRHRVLGIRVISPVRLRTTTTRSSAGSTPGTSRPENHSMARSKWWGQRWTGPVSSRRPPRKRSSTPLMRVNACQNRCASARHEGEGAWA